MTAENEMLSRLRATEKLIAQYGVHQLYAKTLKKQELLPALFISISKAKKNVATSCLIFSNVSKPVSIKALIRIYPCFSNTAKCGGICTLATRQPSGHTHNEPIPRAADFYDIIEECLNITDDAWHCLTERGKQSGEIADLHPDILFSLSLESATNMAEKIFIYEMKSDEQDLEKIIQHSWNAILPPFLI